jgi:hypothetical protein
MREQGVSKMLRRDWAVPFATLLAVVGFSMNASPARTAPSSNDWAEPSSIEWSIQREGSDLAQNKVQFAIESRWGPGNHSMWSNDRSLSDFQGLSAAQVRGPSAPVRFAIARDAGRLDCSGIAGNLTGHGACTFTVNPGFTAYLQQHGIGAPTPHEAFAMTMSGVGRELIDSMESIGYARPTASQLASMAIHGVSADFVRGLARSGPTISISWRHSVTATSAPTSLSRCASTGSAPTMSAGSSRTG